MQHPFKPPLVYEACGTLMEPLHRGSQQRSANLAGQGGHPRRTGVLSRRQPRPLTEIETSSWRRWEKSPAPMLLADDQRNTPGRQRRCLSCPSIMLSLAVRSGVVLRAPREELPCRLLGRLFASLALTDQD